MSDTGRKHVGLVIARRMRTRLNEFVPTKCRSVSMLIAHCI